MYWFKYELHEYMDEKPEIAFRLFKDEEQAKAWAQYMNEHYSGGRTRILGPATKSELIAYIEENHIELDEATDQNVYDPNHYLPDTRS